jgi:hypothetical protein
MTDALIGWLILGGIVVLIMLFKRKKPPSIPMPTIYEGTGRFELFEIVRPVMITAKGPSKAGGFLVNVVILAVVLGFFWFVIH